MKDGAPPVVLFLLGAIVLLQGGCCGVSSHFARYFMTAASESVGHLSQFIAVSYVDNQLMGVYDSSRRRIVPLVSWLQRMEEEEPNLWAVQTEYMLNRERDLRGDLITVRKRYNQSRGLHTWQYKTGCTLSKDGFARYGYDGRDYISFDKETLTWTADDAPALTTKRMWEASLPLCQRYKYFLEDECVGWLQKYLHYGESSLQRTERPVVTVTRKDGHDGSETLLCRAHGFYPKEIDATWRRDGEARQGDTFRGTVSPNADGTYYAWLSIEVDPQERSRFRCHVEHDGLREPLAVAVEEPMPVWLVALGVLLLLGVLLALAVAGVVTCIKKCQGSTSPTRGNPPQRGEPLRAASLEMRESTFLPVDSPDPTKRTLAPSSILFHLREGRFPF